MNEACCVQDGKLIDGESKIKNVKLCLLIVAIRLNSAWLVVRLARDSAWLATYSAELGLAWK